MAVKIGTNIASLSAQRQLSRVSDSVAGTYERLSSGLRINRASDDAAGLAIVSSLNADSRIFTQAIRNVNDGVSLLNIAEGATRALSDVLIRLRELATQSANGSFSITQRRTMNEEGEALVAEFNRITQSTKFNGIQLLDSSLTNLVIQAGHGTGSTLGFGVGTGLSHTVGDGTFQNGVVTASANEPGQVASGDINGDGKLDLVVAGVSSSDVYVHLGNGDGSFQAATTFSSGGSVTSAVLADMNNDGKLDIVSGSQADTSVHIHLGNGNGTFQTAQNFNVGYAVTNVRVADVNGDGKNDIVSAGNASPTFSVLMGNGIGSVSSTTVYNTGASGNCLGFADLNGDGIKDVVSGGTGGTIAISLGAANGTFGAATTRSISGGTLIDVAGVDFNHDGYDDLAITDSTSNTLRVLLNNGSTLTQVMNSGPGGGSGIRQISVADLNGDGYEDLVTATELADGVYVYMGRGDGTFNNFTTLSAGTSPRNTAIGDFNRDGALDIIASLRNVDQIQFFAANDSQTTALSYLNLSSREGALNAFSLIDDALNRVFAELGNLGSAQSRLRVAVANLSTSRENYMAASSRIMDADVASESAELIKNQILQKAATAVLAQANIQPALALTLLKI